MAGFTQSYVTQSRQGILLTSDNQRTTQAYSLEKKPRENLFFLFYISEMNRRYLVLFTNFY